MKWKFPLGPFVAVLAGIASHGPLAQPALLNEEQQMAVFPGQIQFTQAWTNQSSERIDVNITGRVFQESSELAMPLPIEVKSRLQLLANQAALMSVSFEVPEALTKGILLIRWEDGSRVVGKMELVVYPREILRELEALSGGKGIGVSSEDDSIKVAFKKANVRFEDVDKNAIPSFKGRILIVTDCAGNMPVERANKNAIVICIFQNNSKGPLRPNFFAIPNGHGLLIFVQRDFLDYFDSKPESQLRLVQICRMATNSEGNELPMILRKDFNED